MAEFQGRYSYADVPTIAAFARSDAFFRALQGPFGSGKTSGSIMEILARARKQKPGPDGKRHTRWAVIRQTYSELKLTTMKSVFQWLPPAYCGREYVADHRYVLNREPGLDCEIVFLALDRPEDVKKLLSLELTGAWVNEGREIPWAIFDALQGRVGRWPAIRDGGPSWFGIWTDTNGPDTESEYYNFFENQGWLAGFKALKEKGVLGPNAVPADYAAIFKQPSGLSAEAENLANLTPGYYERLAVGKTAEFIKVYIDGAYGFVMDGKLIFPDYNDRVHCQAVDPVAGVDVIRSWDFGLTPACIFSQILPDGRWLVFNEMCATSMGIDRFTDDVLEHCVRSFPPGTKFRDYGDPAGMQRAQTDERTCFEIMWAKSIEIEAGEQGLAIRLESVRKPMRTFMGDGTQFVLHPRCKVLRKGFQGGYHYRRLQVSGAERFSEHPEKNRWSHPMDALQYAATRLFAASLTQALQHDDYPAHDHTEEIGSGRSIWTGY